MAQATKSELYQQLKAGGYVFDKHYRDYTTAELQAIISSTSSEPEQVSKPAPEQADPGPSMTDPYPPKKDETAELREQLAQLTNVVSGLAKMISPAQRRQERAEGPVRAASERLGAKQPPKPQLNPNEFAGVTLNTHNEEDIIEVDEHGNKWFQKEVPKASHARPRARRVLRYNDPGVKEEQYRVGEYTETFEVAGDGKNLRPSEIKITMPSYQTGIYLAPNMPFRIHVYNGVRGYNLDDVHAFYGGQDLVPSTIKTRYVSNDLCYDITSVHRAIETEYRERVLKIGQTL